MLAEACTTGKPVHIFDLGEGRFGMREGAPQRAPVAVPGPWRVSAIRARLKDLKVKLTKAVLPPRLHRDTRPIHRKLVESGRAVWLGDAFSGQPTAQETNDAARVAARIRDLMSGIPQPSGPAQPAGPVLAADRS
jgi:hypothetical protein